MRATTMRVMRRPTVAVGTIIADRPPHRTVRAALPHTAPTLEDWRAVLLLAHHSIVAGGVQMPGRTGRISRTGRGRWRSLRSWLQRCAYFQLCMARWAHRLHLSRRSTRLRANSLFLECRIWARLALPCIAARSLPRKDFRNWLRWASLS